MKTFYKHKNESRWFVTSDLHLDHSEIIKHNPDTRPFKNLDEMHEFIVSHWNNTVRKNDFVIIVGDFAFKNVEKWATILNGKKYLILGDHDYLNQEAKKHFVKICEGLRKTIFRRKIYFHHYPCITWPDRYENGCMIHGHSHGRLEESDFDRRIDVSMDIWNLQVIPIEVIFKKFDSKKLAPKLSDSEKKFREDHKKQLIIINNKLLNDYNN